ncbi:MAG: T9SS type A sorting domain-containing protein [Flavobacteriales bacterium]
MNRSITLILTGFLFNGFATNAQMCTPGTSGTTMDINNVSTYFHDGGDMWWDFNSARYEVPKGSGIKAFFANGLWLTGMDSENKLHCAAVRHRLTGDDFWPGAILTDSNGELTVDCNAFDRHWSVTKAEIDDFKAGGTATEAIKRWPAIGNPEFEVDLTEMVAPFVDADGDGFYNYEHGDYPLIKGDQAVYWIMNDIGNVHTESGGMPFEVEIHVMAYAYQANNVVNNTTFYDYTIINKSDQEYHDFSLGFWTDGGLGYYLNDYVGCDSTRSLGYFYNADSIDPNQGGVLGYGENLPVAGLRMVKLPKDSDGTSIKMTHFGYINNGNGPTTDPGLAMEYYKYMNGKWKDDTDWSIGGTGYDPSNPLAIKTNYMYPENPAVVNGFSECGQATFPGNKRMIQSHSGMNFIPNESKTFTMAVIFSQEEEYKGTCVDVTTFFEQTDTVQAWTDARLCENFNLEVSAAVRNTALSIDTGSITLELSGSISLMEYQWSNGETSKNLSGLAPGEYTVTVMNENGCGANASFEVYEIVGVENVNPLDRLTYYPNPSGSGVFITNFSPAEKMMVEVYNLIGEKIDQQSIANVVDLSEFQSGIYLIRTSIEEYSNTQRIVIAR